MMWHSWGGWVFTAAPIILAALLLLWFPRYRWRVRWRPLLTYLVVMTAIITATLHLVAYIASARVVYREVAVILWFTIIWRLAWEIWSTAVNRIGRRWTRWAAWRRRHGRAVPFAVRLLPWARGAATMLIFGVAFFSMVVTHRFKLADGQTPLDVFQMPYESVHIPTTDGLTLDGWFIPEAGADRTILICHGAGANKGNFIWFLGPLLGDYVLAAMSLQAGTSFFDVSAESSVRQMGTRPVMVIHGNADPAMPTDHAQRLYDAALGPREIWFGPGPHSNIITTVPDEYARRVFEFLDRTIGSTRRRNRT